MAVVKKLPTKCNLKSADKNGNLKMSNLPLRSPGGIKKPCN